MSDTELFRAGQRLKSRDWGVAFRWRKAGAKMAATKSSSVVGVVLLSERVS